MTLLEKLLHKKKSERLTMKEISEQLDIKAERINSWIKNNTEPKHSDGIKINNWLNGQNAIIEKGLLSEDAVGNENLKNSDLSLQAIVNLTTTNQTLANNSSRLISLLEEKEKKTTVGSPVENFSIAPETLQALLQVFGEVATGKRWKSKAEFEAYVNTLSFDKIMAKQAVGK